MVLRISAHLLAAHSHATPRQAKESDRVDERIVVNI